MLGRVFGEPFQLEALAVQAEPVGFQLIQGQLLPEGALPAAQEIRDILRKPLDGLRDGSLPPAEGCGFPAR